MLAGQHGIGMYGVTLGGIPKYADLVADYRRAIKDCDTPIGAFISNQVRASARMYIHADSKHAQEMVGKPGELPSDNLSALQLPVSTSYPSPAYFSHSQGSGLFSPFGSDQVGRMIGNPEEVGRAVEDWYKLGVDAINLQIEGRFLSFEDKTEALRLFAKEVSSALRTPRDPGYIRDAA